MTSIVFSRRAETSPLSVLWVAFKGFSYLRKPAFRRKQLLGIDDHLLLMGLDHQLLLDLGLERMNARCGKF
jgi:hypothetical protein